MCRKQCGSKLITENRELLSVNATQSHPNEAMPIKNLLKIKYAFRICHEK